MFNLFIEVFTGDTLWLLQLIVPPFLNISYCFIIKKHNRVLVFFVLTGVRGLIHKMFAFSWLSAVATVVTCQHTLTNDVQVLLNFALIKSRQQPT